MVSQERVRQRTSEQFEVQMNTSSTSTSEQTVDIPIPRSVEEIGDMSVQLSTHAINECMHSLKISKEKVAKLEEVTSCLSSRLQVLTKSPGSRHAARQVENVSSSRRYVKSGNLFLTRSSSSLKRCAKNNIF